MTLKSSFNLLPLKNDMLIMLKASSRCVFKLSLNEVKIDVFPHAGYLTCNFATMHSHCTVKPVKSINKVLCTFSVL